MFKRTVKQFTHIIIASQLTIFCWLLFTSEKSKPTLKDLFPEEIGHHQLGMPLAEFKNSNKDARLIDDGNYQESLIANSISRITYHFDSIGNQPLYEIIVSYKNEALMELNANKLFGTAKHKVSDDRATECRFGITDESNLHISTFENKIIYAMHHQTTKENGSVHHLDL